jgi:monoterpene epsilon-lactone hydrolase
MEDIKQRRERFNQLGNLYPKETSVNVEQAFINGVNCYWFTPQQLTSNNIVIYLHGGVFAIGSINSHESMVSHIANKLQSKVLFVDYSLAPEKPYPAAPNDVMVVYREVINTYPDSDINFIGDSAGGGLIVSAVSKMINQHLQLPAAVAFISGWISLTCDNPSHEENRNIDPILTREYAKSSAADYAGKTSMEIVSPEFIEFNQFPPVLLMVGTNEILIDDSKNFYNYIKAIQPKAKLIIYENQAHVWPLANIQSEASQNTLTEINDFFKTNSR